MQRIRQATGRILRRFAWALAALALLPGVARADGMTVFAASSLRDVLEEIATTYEARTGTDVTLVFAASSAIARQVAAGAPADVVLLADLAWADWLVDQGTVEAMQPVVGNRLVLVGTGGEIVQNIEDLDAALGDGVLAMAQVDAVPAGRYGRAALVSLGVWEALEPRVVQAANVRAALRFVERGEARFGIGYASDLVGLPGLTRAYRFAPRTHPAIVYSGAALTDRGAEFEAFLFSRSAQDSFVDWGFSLLDPIGD